MYDPEKGQTDVIGLFHNDDIDQAVNTTIDYVKNHDIHEDVSLFEFIKTMHQHAVDHSDNRAKSAVVWKDNDICSNRTLRAGIYRNFSQLPDNIFIEIEDKAREILDS